jgi:hypothetical protein
MLAYHQRRIRLNEIIDFKHELNTISVNVNWEQIIKTQLLSSL